MKLSKTQQRGFSLVEVVLALGIASFCLVGLLALLPAGLSNNHATVQRTVASGFAAEVAADLCHQPVGGKSPRFQIELPAANSGSNMAAGSPATIYLTDSGGAAPSPSADSRYRVSVGFAPPAAGSREATMVRILVTWPAQADPTPTVWPARYAGAYEVITAVDCN